MADDPSSAPPSQPEPPAQGPPDAPTALHTVIYYGNQGNGIGVAAGVCGIIAVALCWIPFVDYVSIVLGALAIILGVLGLRRANLHGAGRGMAVTGIVCGIVGLAIAIIVLLLIYAIVSSVTVIGAGGG